MTELILETLSRYVQLPKMSANAVSDDAGHVRDVHAAVGGGGTYGAASGASARMQVTVLMLLPWGRWKNESVFRHFREGGGYPNGSDGI